MGSANGRNRRPGSEDGQAIAEFAFAFPLQLFIMFAIMQLALVYVAKQVVHYASYSAARSAMVAETSDDAWRRARTAAAVICSPITGTTVSGTGYSYAALTGPRAELSVPGWGRIPKSGISYHLKTHVSQPAFSGRGEVTVTVDHYYELIFPIVNHAFAWVAGDGPDRTGRSRDIYRLGAPHLRLRETTTLAIPGSEAARRAG